MRLLLLGTQGCHLCEQAEQLIDEYVKQSVYELEIENIDIAEHEQWQENYATRIPVLYQLHTQQHLVWPFSKEDIKKFLAHL